MEKRIEALFQPIKIGTCEIKNRIVQCPMDPGPIVDSDRKFDYRARNILEERARGGVGLLITGSIYVLTPEWDSFADYRDVFLGPATEMCKNIHQYGAKVFGQLTIGVGRCQFLTPENVKDIDRSRLVAPSDGVPNAWMPEIKLSGVSKDWIGHLLQCFRDSAKLLKDAGFDGIEVHALHEGYLLDQFAIEKFNHRTDEYGGTLENRLRLAKELLQAVKDSCGEKFPTIMRMSMESKMKGLNDGALPGERYEEYGRCREESREIAVLLEKMGYDAIDADNGSNDAWYWSHPPVYMPHLCNLEDVAFVKQAVRIPMFCAGKMDDPYRIAKAIEQGKIDCASIGRTLLAEPDWPNKVKEGRMEEIRPCISCQSGCFRIVFGQSMTCAINPRLGMANERDFGKSDRPGRIAIVGGGIGGMESARICSLRGHKVDLFEKDSKLGGVFNAAAMPACKAFDRKLLAWYEHEMERCGIMIHLNTTISAAELAAKGYDRVIAATGSKERRLPIPMDVEADMRTAIEALCSLDTVGKRAVIVGGGLTGCEIAYELALNGRKVSVVEMLPDILQTPFLNPANSMMLRNLLTYYKVNLYKNSKVVSIGKEGVCIESKGKQTEIPTDTVVIAAGYVPNHTLFDELIKLGVNAYNIGDSREVGNLLSVVENAYDCAMSF